MPPEDPTSTAIKVYRGFSAALLDAMHTLETRIFDNPYPRDTLQRKCFHQHNLLGLVALSGEQAVAFKVGYKLTPSKFYSWIGGVDPDFRHRGLAYRLM
jgi:ribosomal protein S18 acetylase RimI-like enzyme